MQNLAIYCLGLKFHKFVKTLYIFCVQPKWICAHYRLDGVVLVLKNGKRIFLWDYVGGDLESRVDKAPLCHK